MLCGASASQLAVDAFIHAVEQGGGLDDGLRDANQAVGRGALARHELTGWGPRWWQYICGDEVRWISVGDSPFYLVEGAGFND